MPGGHETDFFPLDIDMHQLSRYRQPIARKFALTPGTGTAQSGLAHSFTLPRMTGCASS
jgi:hypothetical protein